AIAMVDEHSHHRVCHQRRLGWLHDDAGRAGKILVTRNAAHGEAKPDPRLDSEAVLHGHRGKADVDGVLQHRSDAATVEAHVELARDAIEGAVVENVEVPVARIGPSVDELLRIDPGSRGAGDVADIVGARTARTQADVLDVLDQSDGALGLYFA